jgi:hypothetical protein
MGLARIPIRSVKLMWFPMLLIYFRVIPYIISYVKVASAKHLKNLETNSR